MADILSGGVGVTIAADLDDAPEVLIIEVETAIRRVKQGGDARVKPDARDTREQLRARIENTEALAQAVAREEFRVVYQPKMSLSTDRMTGVEALLRWYRPMRGVVQPLEFIPIAEETGLITSIGAWVLEEGCRDAKRWSTALAGGRSLVVAINVSPRQFSSGLAESFGAIIASAGIDPASICLEVTESVLMEDVEFAITTLRELKMLGLAISIDDFGTGYSSLAYLRRFPLDELKIDKLFVDGLGRDAEATAIVAAMMGMAHALDLRVVAEGVETVDQVAMLRTLGCDEAQGFFYARAAPAEDIDNLLLVEAKGTRQRHNDAGARRGDLARAERILVVDDAADVRMLARSSLAAVGFEVQEACSGEEAITLTRHFKPDCIVLDLNMPGISGTDVCRVLRDDTAFEHMTIVILTSDADPAEKVRAFSLNADDYIVKPFSPRDLVSRVTTAMRRRSELPAAIAT